MRSVSTAHDGSAAELVFVVSGDGVELTGYFSLCGLSVSV